MTTTTLREELLTGATIGVDCRKLTSVYLLDQPRIAPMIDWLARLGHAVVRCSHCDTGGVWSGVYTDRGIATGVGRVSHWLPLTAQALASLKDLALHDFERVERGLSTLSGFQSGAAGVAPFCAVHAEAGPLPAVAPFGQGEQFPWGDCPDVWTCSTATIPIPAPSRRRTHHPACR
jgi:hypothetical protein